ncbi:hypothetical protein ACFWGN_18565 [Oerskovia sp. NPDC060338]|uniref:hypothetical protein n=1 Tax=Oerskovia sp. NPDC060338 TaxID=3347100 RepID=UPI0036624FFC
MRDITPEALSALNGSRPADTLTINAWRDGELIAASLPVQEWQISTDSTRQVQTQVQVTFADSNGTLAPWSVDDILGVAGTRLQMIYTIGGSNETVDIGWFRISAVEPVRNFRVITVNDGQEIHWVSGGASIPVSADDLTINAVYSRLLAPESPKAGATVLGEVRRLLADVCAVEVAAGVTDATVPTSVVYERERMDAVEDLLSRINCTHRMTGDGLFQVYPLAVSAPVWTIAPGPGGALVSVQTQQALDGLYNAVVSSGTTATGLPVSAVATEAAGPLRWDGPHGRQPMFHSSPLITSAALALKDAQTTLSNRIASRSVMLTVTCLPNPALQVGDTVVVAQPLVGAEPFDLIGQVTSLSLRGSAEASTTSMTLNVVCDYRDLQIMAGVESRD